MHTACAEDIRFAHGGTLRWNTHNVRIAAAIGGTDSEIGARIGGTDSEIGASCTDLEIGASGVGVSANRARNHNFYLSLFLRTCLVR